jgi:uncharacterized protein
MPLLTCPNDNAPMQPVRREGVEIDVCSQCRGVWLDRGELEKLLSYVRGSDDDHRPQAAPAARPAPGYVERRDDDDDYRGRSGEYGKRKKRFDIFDIFD